MNGDMKTLQVRRFEALLSELGNSLYNRDTGQLLPMQTMMRYVLPESMSQARAYVFRKWLTENHPYIDAPGQTVDLGDFGAYANDDDDGYRPDLDQARLRAMWDGETDEDDSKTRYAYLDEEQDRPMSPQDLKGRVEARFPATVEAGGKTYKVGKPDRNGWIEVIEESPAKPEPKTEMVVIASDFHGRSVDPFLYDAFRSFLRSHKIDQLILNGDIFDGESVSKYAKSNTLSWGEEVKTVSRMLREMVSDVRAKNPSAKVTWIDGNHEERFYKYLALNAPAVAGVDGMATIRSLLKMDEIDVEYRTSRQYIKLHHGLFVQHRYLVNPTAGTSASNSIKKLGGSIAIGDTHRIGNSWKLDRNGLHVALEIGCLCQLDAEYIYESGANWQNGFLVVRYHGEDKMPEYVQVVCHDGKFAVDGVVYGS